MDPEILAIAIVKPFDGRKHDVLALLTDFYAVLARKGYCRDLLYRSHKDPSRFFDEPPLLEVRRNAPRSRRKIRTYIATGTS